MLFATLPFVCVHRAVVREDSATLCVLPDRYCFICLIKKNKLNDSENYFLIPQPEFESEGSMQQRSDLGERLTQGSSQLRLPLKDPPEKPHKEQCCCRIEYFDGDDELEC